MANSRMPDGLAYEEMVVGEISIGFVVEYQYLKSYVNKAPEACAARRPPGEETSGNR